MKAIISKDGKVVNAPLLRRYWKEWRRRDALIRRGMFADIEPIEQVLRQKDEGEGQASAGDQSQPWAKDQWQYVKAHILQVEGQVLYLNGKVDEMRSKRKPRGKY